MNYTNILEGNFISRPNRFIANVKINGVEEICHVKNTGRCKELLIQGCSVYLEKSCNMSRKTKYDLVAVKKGDRLINIDSQAPNKAVQEFLPLLFKDAVLIKPECKYGNSRFDFYIETMNKKIFLEVKGVTLEDNGIVRFPDAPTERGIKHVGELIKCIKDGYSSYIFFVVQMDNVLYFEPNDDTHKEFGDILRTAEKSGVNILAYDCIVTPDSMIINKPVDVKLR